MKALPLLSHFLPANSPATSQNEQEDAQRKVKGNQDPNGGQLNLKTVDSSPSGDAREESGEAEEWRRVNQGRELETKRQRNARKDRLSEERKDIARFQTRAPSASPACLRSSPVGEIEEYHKERGLWAQEATGFESESSLSRPSRSWPDENTSRAAHDRTPENTSQRMARNREKRAEERRPLRTRSAFSRLLQRHERRALSPNERTGACRR